MSDEINSAPDLKAAEIQRRTASLQAERASLKKRIELASAKLAVIDQQLAALNPEAK